MTADEQPDTRPRIQWKLCKDGNPPPDEDTPYIVTTCTNDAPHEVDTHYGKFVPPQEGDTEPKAMWIILLDGENDEANWELPEFWNCQVIAWAEMPRPYTGHCEHVFIPSDMGGGESCFLCGERKP